MGCVSSNMSVSSSGSFRASNLNSSDEFRAESSNVNSTSRSPRFGELKGPQVSRLTQHQQSLVGVARWPSSHFNRDHTPYQMEYGQSFYHKSRELGAAIAGGDVNSFSEAWDEARDWRSARAGNDAEEFSKIRDPNRAREFITPLTGPYEYIKDRHARRKDAEVGRPSRSLPKSKVFKIHGKIDGENFLLTCISISTDRHADRTKEPYPRLRRMGMNDIGEPNVILHTDAEHIPRILQHVEGLYGVATDATIPDAHALKTLAEIHWWAVHAVPDMRGSAAKAELCVRSIAQARGMDLPPMKLGIVPDLEALTMNLRDFVNSYEGFFDHS
ncbi:MULTISPECIES: XopAH/AvrB family type III secretion system effector [Pseudomonas syringae group]|uniref:XopAH/AvrB family type III secretion system effector n=1 Tax=Pseudomonas syringae group TaxID=136849 RepID=UPI000EFE9618|nr:MULTISPECIES: XopAH/AvrB family type III secretion system effector [Pseudomonas syringae group]MCF5803733.1 type III effector [Pseudomonas tremae]MCF5811238.1 type III effector [Pseudomonas tremae]RMN23088.1 Type III effector protein AvrB3 [Pseudomonas coronafaciens pv. zizaniae]RMN34782.1 Type III effector protein AvrB3 [Pseudomonas coronafaciens pv. zizaniae]